MKFDFCVRYCSVDAQGWLETSASWNQVLKHFLHIKTTIFSKFQANCEAFDDDVRKNNN